MGLLGSWTATTEKSVSLLEVVERLWTRNLHNSKQCDIVSLQARVAQLVEAVDLESARWGFESLRGYFENKINSLVQWKRRLVNSQ